MIGLLLVLAPLAAQDEERTRALWDTNLIRARPQAAAPKAPGSKAPAVKKETTPAPVPAAGTLPPLSPQDDPGDALVGVTVWRLRELKEGDDKDTAIPGARPGEQWVGERIESGAPLVSGQRVRISIESARSGFLYVIDREQYADGAYGPADLIFPTLRIQAGRNDVVPGRIVELPGWDDNPRYFTMTTSRPDHVSEVLTVLVTPQPIPGLQIRRDPLRLSPAQVSEWEMQWGASVKKLEARGQVGKPYSRAEKQAGQERTRRLTHEEPLPQTLFWCDAKPGDPLLVNVPLRLVR